MGVMRKKGYRKKGKIKSSKKGLHTTPQTAGKT